jgi:hypothetical protein
MNWKTAAILSACFTISASPGAGAQGSKGSTARRLDDGEFPALRFIKWVEPKEHSFSVEIPQGWAVQGGVNWLGQIDPQQFVRLTSPNGKINVYLGDPEIMTREVPTPAGRQQTGVNEGQVFRSPSGGPALLESWHTGSQYAQEHVAWRFCRDPQWVTVKELPDVTRAMATAIAGEIQRFNPNIRGTASAGEATYVCGDMQGAAFATTFLMGEGMPIQVWGVYRLVGFQSSDPLHTMEARYIMEHLLATLEVDPHWQAELDRKTMQLTGAVIQMQNAAVQSALAASRQQNETLSRMNHPNAGVPSRSSTGIGGSSSGRGVNTTLGTAHVCDAIGRCATVSNTADSYYMDHSGSVRAGSAGSPPDNSGVWSRLY